MNRRSRRIANRRDTIYAFFKHHPDEFYSLSDMCAAVGCDAGKTTRVALRGVRSLAQEDGWWFPPAVPATAARYVLTHDPAKLLDPALHMGRIKLGVGRTEKALYDAIQDHKADLAPADRAMASAALAAHEFMRKQEAASAEYLETVTRELVAVRKQQRAEGD